MIRTCVRCGDLHEVDGGEDVLRWLCGRCWAAGWRVDRVGNVRRDPRVPTPLAPRMTRC
jgi:hypothetical protein